MAVERNPFDRIERDNIIEIGIGPTSTEIETPGVSYEFEDDGGVVIEFGEGEEDGLPEYDMNDQEGFFRNLVDDLDEATLQDIAEMVYENYQADKESRADWESMFERGFDLFV